MITMKCFAAALLAALASSGISALTLPEAQAVLRERSLDLALSKSQVRLADAALGEARSAWHPSLVLHGAWAWQSETQSIEMALPFPLKPLSQELGDKDRVEAGADLSWPLFTGFARLNASRARTFDRESQSARAEAMENRLFFQLGMLYFGWELASARLAVQERLVAQLEEYARDMKNLVEAGVAQAARFSEAEARLASTRAEFLTAGNQADSMKAEILNFVNSTDTAAALSPYGRTPDSAEVERLLSLEPPEERPETRAYDLALGALNAQEGVVSSRYWPIVAGSAGVRYGNPGLSMGADEYMGWGVAGLSLNWNLYDGFRTKSSRAQIAENIEMTKLNREKEMEALEKGLAMGRLKLRQAVSRMAAAELSLGASQRLVDDLKNSREAGTATSQDYLNALSGEAQARFLVDQSLFILKSAALAVKYNAGEKIEY
jgi:outer membrane protein TolC